MSDTEQPDYAALLRQALEQPGIVADCYRAFHNYSMGNQLMASWQIAAKGLPVGPIATFPGWRAKGRQVRKGEKAIALWMPVTVKITKEQPQAEPGQEPVDGSRTFTKFVVRNNWFTLAQTDPIPDAPMPEPEQLPAEWSLERALTALGITERPWNSVDGNCQGWAIPTEHVISVNPLAQHPTRTRLHEMAHCLLHADTPGTDSDGANTPRNEKELEAEGTAYLVSATLGLPGAEESRGYMQSWYQDGKTIPDNRARRIMAATDRILKAGKPAKAEAAL